MTPEGLALRRVKAVAVDVDGTITVDRGVFLLDFEAARALQTLVERGIHVILVTGNSVPVVASLARYLGFEKSPHVAENGCLVFYKGRIFRSCSEDAREAALIIERVLEEYLEPSWQNRYRECDYAYTLRDKSIDPRDLMKRALDVLRSKGFDGIYVSYSGYAIHVRPRCVSKCRGLELALRLAGVSGDEAIAVGDSSIDSEMKMCTSMLFAVANSDEELKRSADYVLSGRSGRGVVELVALLEKAQFDLNKLSSLLGLNQSRGS